MIQLLDILFMVLQVLSAALVVPEVQLSFPDMYLMAFLHPSISSDSQFFLKHQFSHKTDISKAKLSHVPS